MATRVELPKDLVKLALQGAISLRVRQDKAASNALIAKALQDEIAALTTAMNTLTEIK